MSSASPASKTPRRERPSPGAARDGSKNPSAASEKRAAEQTREDAAPSGAERQGAGTPRGRRRGERWPRWSIWLLGAVVLLVAFMPQILRSSDSTAIDYSAFIDAVSDENVVEATFVKPSGQITAKLADGSFVSTEGPDSLPDADLMLLRDRGVTIEYDTERANLLLSLLPLMLPFGLIFLFFWWMQRRAQGQMSGIMSIGRSRAKTYSTERPQTRFDDIAGYDAVKSEITEVVDFLRMPERFSAIGARVPKGVLLVGPPGTGKTMIARAVAGEAGVPFLSVTGSDFMEMFVGVGASRVRDLFNSARKLGKAIIFIDEIDSIGRKRGAGLGGGHDEREQTLNQMLSEMDGFEESGGIVMMAATNRPDILDPALLRPGRFDRQVVVPLPEYSERLAILDVHSKDKNVDPDVQFEAMAKGTTGMSGADLANLVNEAALAAVRRDSDSMGQDDFETARDRIMIGQRRDSVAMTAHEREVTAYHEGGHALVATLFEHADPVHKVTILPTGQALGVTMQLPEERHAYSQQYIEDRLAVLFGGRMAEETVFGVTSTGAANDLMQGTELARKMVAEWGMSERIGPMAWGSSSQVFLGEDLVSGREYSDETARVIDEEVERILRTQQDRARQALISHREVLDRVAAALLERETVTGRDIELLAAGETLPVLDDPADDADSSTGTGTGTGTKTVTDTDAETAAPTPTAPDASDAASVQTAQTPTVPASAAPTG